MLSPLLLCCCCVVAAAILIDFMKYIKRCAGFITILSLYNTDILVQNNVYISHLMFVLVYLQLSIQLQQSSEYWAHKVHDLSEQIDNRRSTLH